jgi:hypothetical protein
VVVPLDGCRRAIVLAGAGQVRGEVYVTSEAAPPLVDLGYPAGDLGEGGIVAKGALRGLAVA